LIKKVKKYFTFVETKKLNEVIVFKNKLSLAYEGNERAKSYINRKNSVIKSIMRSVNFHPVME